MLREVKGDDDIYDEAGNEADNAKESKEKEA